MFAAAALVVGVHGADPVEPYPIPAAGFDPGTVMSLTAIVGLRELHLPGLCLASAACGGGHGMASLVMPGPCRLGLASAALDLGGLFAAAMLVASLAATIGILGMGLMTPALAAWSGGRRGCNSQRRCAGSEHPFRHGISPSQPFKRPERERVPPFIWRSALSGR